MMKKKLNEALNEICDAHIEEAATAKKAHRRTLWRIVAAAAAVAVVIGLFQLPRPVLADAISLPAEYRAQEYTARKKVADRALDALADFLTEGNAEFLGGDGTQNVLWSPVNAYIGLAMSAELTQGESRAQILELLGAQDTQELRTQVSAVWESTYLEGNEACTLANSLWLQKGLHYEQEATDALGYHYYASVYQTELSRAGSAIGAWLDNNTGGLLKKATQSISLPQDSVLALYSTIYFQSKWTDEFHASNNTTGVFHAANGERSVTFMNKRLAMMDYYYGEHFGAVVLGLKNGASMWLILPDEGSSTDEVLANGEYMQMLLGQEYENSKYVKVNLSMPKFDISSQANLAQGLQNMGVTDIFDPGRADFSAITGDTPVFFTAANQAVRVQVDEQGVKAAAYLEMPAADSPMPPDEIVDFVLDRPFLFVIARNNVPLFAGVVNDPA